MLRSRSLLPLLIVSIASCGEPGVTHPVGSFASDGTAKIDEPRSNGSIVFTREQSDGGCDLFANEPDGSRERPLTDTASTCETGATVAPRKSMVAVSLDLNDIALIDLTTSALRPLTDDPNVLDGSPAWSPDASQIAFFRGPPLGQSHLYVMDTDGSDLRQLTRGSVWDRNAAWSPDGTRIAFARSGND